MVDDLLNGSMPLRSPNPGQKGIMPPILTVVDLFCGAGGLSLGFLRTGCDIVVAFDNWNPAVDTYRNNFRDHISALEITQETDVPTTDIIVGGPPCQGFLSAGMRRDDDHRNSLVRVFSQIVARVRPHAFSLGT